MFNKIVILIISTLFLSSYAFAGSKAKTAAAFLKSDKNKDSQLSQREFKSFIQTLSQTGNARANYVVQGNAFNEAYRALDKDKSGSISLKEAKKGT